MSNTAAQIQKTVRWYRLTFLYEFSIIILSAQVLGNARNFVGELTKKRGQLYVFYTG